MTHYTKRQLLEKIKQAWKEQEVIRKIGEKNKRFVIRHYNDFTTLTLKLILQEAEEGLD